MALEVKKNTYVTLAEADAYFESRLGSEAWETASASDKEKALITAARIMNGYRYLGRKMSSDQSLAFPRIMINADLTEAQLVMYNQMAEIPEDVSYAQCEQAIYLIEGEDNNRMLMESGVQSYGAGGASFTLQNDGYAALSPKARHFLSPYLSRIGGLR